MSMHLGLLTSHLNLPGCASLKEKRGRLKPLLTRLPAQFNISAAEVDYLDTWQSALIAVALVSNDERHNMAVLTEVTRWIEQNFPELEIITERYEDR